MTPAEAYLIMGGIYLFVVVELVVVIWWLRRNNTLLLISKDDLGTKILKEVRCREVARTRYKLPTGRVVDRLPRARGDPAIQDMVAAAEKIEDYEYYWMWDLRNRQPYKVQYGRMNEIIAESAPIIGIKKVIKAQDTTDGLQAYTISRDVPEGAKISLNLVSWISESRHELHEETKRQLSKAEIFAQMAIPVGMIVLALACLVFFPKIYNTIMETGNQAAKTAGQNLAEVVKGLMPGG